MRRFAPGIDSRNDVGLDGLGRCDASEPLWLEAAWHSSLSWRSLSDEPDRGIRSPNFHQWSERCFAVILLLVVIAFVGNRPVTRKLRLSHLLVVLLATYAGFYSSRNLPVSSILLVLISARSYGRTWFRWRMRRVPGDGCDGAARESRVSRTEWARRKWSFGDTFCRLPW